MKKKFLFAYILTFFGISIYAQVGIQTDTPHASAALEVSTEKDSETTKKGLLIPRITTEQRDFIATPAEGLTIFNSTVKKLEFFNGTKWITITTI